MQTKTQIKNGSHYFFATIAVIFANYFFHLITARGLASFEYGVLSGLFAFFGIIAFTSISLQTKTTEIAARLIAQNDLKKLKDTQKEWILKIFKIALSLTLVGYLSTYFLQQFFHTTALNICLFLPVFCLTIPLSAIRGFLQGQQRYRELSQNFLTESFLKLALALLAIKLNLNLSGILITLSLSQLPSFLIGLKQIFNTSKLKKLKTKPQPTNNKINTFFIFWYFGLFALWFNFDMMSVQHFLPKIAGSYSVASKLGQFILFATTNVGTFLFPLFIENTEKNKSNQKLILIGLALIIGGGLFGIFLLDFFNKFFVIKLFGIKYAEAIEWIKYFGIFGIFIGITHLQVQLFLAQGKFKFLYFLSFATVGFMIHFLWKILHNPNQIFQILLLWSFIFSLILIPFEKIKKNTSKIICFPFKKH